MSETQEGFQHRFERFTGRASVFSLVASALTSVLDYDTRSQVFLNGGFFFGLGRGASKLISYTSQKLSSVLSGK